MLKSKNMFQGGTQAAGKLYQAWRVAGAIMLLGSLDSEDVAALIEGGCEMLQEFRAGDKREAQQMFIAWAEKDGPMQVEYTDLSAQLEGIVRDDKL